MNRLFVIGGIALAALLLYRKTRTEPEPEPEPELSPYAVSVVAEQGTGPWGGWLGDPRILHYLSLDPAYNARGKCALGAPDGLPVIINKAGSQVVLGIDRQFVNSLKIYMVRQYNINTAVLFNIYVSDDGQSWTKLTNPTTMLYGDDVWTLPVNMEVSYVKIFMHTAGVRIGVDAIEVI